MTETRVDPGLSTDQRVWLTGASWADYERLLAIRGEKAVPRITFLEGEIELLSPSRRHERTSRLLGLLLSVYAAETGIVLNGLGSWTLKRRRRRGGLEPDECFELGTEEKPRPDLAIEVVVTSGGIDKLEVYRKIEVPEVWFWEEGRLEVHVLRGKRYERAPKSVLLPDLDLALLARLAESKDQTQAMRELQRALRR